MAIDITALQTFINDRVMDNTEGKITGKDLNQALGGENDTTSEGITSYFKKVGDLIDDESTARVNAVSAEATTRQSADTTLQTNIDNEATARSTADTDLDARVTTLEAKHASGRSVAQEAQDAIDQLDVNQIGGTGKVITTVAQANGLLSAVAVDSKYIGLQGAKDSLGNSFTNDPDDGKVTIPNATTSSVGLINEAPSDSKFYARKDGAWVESTGNVSDVTINGTSIVDASKTAVIPVASDSVLGVMNDAPSDGTSYARKDGTWIAETGGTVDTAMSATSANAVQNKVIKAYVDDSINALDVTDTAVAGQAVRSVSETDGKVSVTRSATVDKVQLVGTDLTNNAGTVGIPAATTSSYGVVKIGTSYEGSDKDKYVVSASSNGSLAVKVASDSQYGVVKTDGTTTEIVDGKLHVKGMITFIGQGEATAFPATATECDAIVTTAGKTVAVSQIVSITMSGTYKGQMICTAVGTPNTWVEYSSASVPDATTTTKGIVSVGTNLEVNSGVVSVPTSNKSTLGVVKVGDNINVSSGTISVPMAHFDDTSTEYVAGVVKVEKASGIPTDLVSGIIALDSDDKLAIAKAGDGSYGVIEDVTLPASNGDDDPQTYVRYVSKNSATGVWEKSWHLIDPCVQINVGSAAQTHSSQNGVITLPAASASNLGCIKLPTNASKLYGMKGGAWTEVTGSVVDTAMSDTSTNAVQNNTIKAYVDAETTARTTAVSQEVSDRNTAITSAINGLNVGEAGGSGYCIQSIKQENGKISVTTAALPTGSTVDTSMSGSSANAVQNKVIKSYVDSQISTEVTNRNTAISNAVKALDKSDTAVTGQAVRSVSETDGIITVSRSATVDTVKVNGTALTNSSGAVNIPAATSSAYGVNYGISVVSATTIPSSLATRTFYNITSAQASSVSISLPSMDVLDEITIQFTYTSGTITWPTVKWLGGSAPTLTSGNTYVVCFRNGLGIYSEFA